MKIIQKILNDVYPSKDYVLNSIIVDGVRVYFFYNEVLVDIKSINDFIMKKIIFLRKKELKELQNNISSCNTLVIKDKDIFHYIHNGFLIIICDKIYACELRSDLSRGISTIESELSISGPKDSFTEIINTNLGLIRKRIKSTKLKSLTMQIGKYSKTKIDILYIDGIVKKDLVEHIRKKLLNISIDGILDSSYLKYSLENPFQLFPTIIMTERPDKSCMALLEGKVIILVDNSPYVLILPSLFIDYFHTTDDYYQKSFHTSFIRIIRFLAFIISVFTPAIYISITTRNYNLVPLSLLLMLKAGRTFVPFPAYIEALFMIVCFEILKESDLRMSTTSGSAISILGGLVLGDAAVAAGIVSPIMIIVIAISSIAGLIFTSFELGNTIRSYKLFLLLLGTIFGIYGVFMGSILMIYQIINTEIFGYSYLSIDKNELKDSIVKIDTKIRKRNSKLTKNIIRGHYR